MELYSESGSVYGKRVLDAVRLGDESLRRPYQPVSNNYETTSASRDRAADRIYIKEGV